MKKQLLIILITVVFCLRATAQCVPAIPAAAVIINTNDTINGGFDNLWVCKSDTLVSNGGFHNIFLEANAHMFTGGGIDSIWVKRGASLYMNGGIHVIIYERISDVTIAGGIPTLDSCGQIVFNYSNAPSNGCAVPLLAFFQANDSSLCGSTCINFTSLSSNATSWQWFFPGATPDTSTDENPQNICYDSTGSYTVTLVAMNGMQRDTLTLNNFIALYPQPVLPSLIQNGDTLFAAQGYAVYQWYFGSDTISGATDYFYVATQNGNYNLTVTDSNGCEVGEGILNVIAQASHPNLTQGEGVELYPNPAKGEFTIYCLQFAFSELEIFNLLGEKVFREELRTRRQMINPKLQQGIYFVRVSGDKKSIVQKFIVE